MPTKQKKHWKKNRRKD